MLKLGTRGSPLALWQAHWVRQGLEARDPELRVELVTVKTDGERYPDREFQEIGVGVFTHKLDQALLEGRVDLAVHSAKDMPSTLTAGLELAAILPRESPLDAFISGDGRPLGALEPGARIGTGSPRRKALLLARYPELVVVPLRGNVETRLRKIAEEELAGTILAHAGLRRLGREDVITEVLSREKLLPAVGQGAVAVVARAGEAGLAERLARLEDPADRAAIDAERGFLRELRGGCQVPAAAHARTLGERLELEALIASADGASLVRGKRTGALADREALGRELAREMLAKGGAALLGRANEPPPGTEDA